ncbi:phosphocholine-specific phospholipase C [Chitinophaga sp. XS-30]|uniref:phosphocholine-specific phospholipase C n=1 Tax=Chitinophaga sp. XS-30 TaxID=2604421 RepID=UPI0011DDCACB|nr:phospholipase C, phosphocholine-specific [Chitinophaga sp. XS-30]QEH41871.1 phospholipase C, phosphocholine-specific [Chitinophaga sp. XS-30]
MDTRREFLRKAALLTGAGGLANILPETIQRAMAIDPAPGSSYLDAEHVVFLMQENRSFDHCFGTLKGVRGFNDPRALKLENGNPVFLQSNAAGETYAPFRMNIKDTKATWMSALPHAWADQVDARNNGKYDKWLDIKRSGNKAYSKMPLTMGYYNREDLPFYYALADAFTVCDQHFCSSLTGTTPNRLFFFTGTIRQEQNGKAKANVWNSDVDYGKQASWKTFPETLEEHDISWKIYQNEISVGVGFEGEEDSWLANFTDNPIEWFSQYHVEYSEAHQQHLRKLQDTLPQEITTLETRLSAQTPGSEEHAATTKTLGRRRAALEKARAVLDKIAETPFSALPEREQQLHRKAFSTNVNDPAYHQLTSLKYNDGDTEREVKLPAGDILHQFRQDVKNGQLPVVSWIVAPENFSDHPGAPWYGAWYVSEVMDILTQNPEVWKKTIFVLTYDENDGYFDHVPPFVAPKPADPSSGKVSAGIDTAVEYVTPETQAPGDDVRASAIGLGYRVPMVVASPWSRGGYVNSQVFDHTSDLQFLEKFLSHRTRKKIAAENISAWRRTVCGDLTSVFRPWNGEKIKPPASVDKEAFIKTVHQAKFREAPANFIKLTQKEISQFNAGGGLAAMPQQEPGIRPSCAIPYELYADAKPDAGRKNVILQLSARNQLFGASAAGAPFSVYTGSRMENRSYAVKAGDELTDAFAFEDGAYHLRVYGPNGFYREMKGDESDPELMIKTDYRKSGILMLELRNDGNETLELEVRDNAYKSKRLSAATAPGKGVVWPLNLAKSHGWYDFSIIVKGAGRFERRYAGHLETGKPSFSDPLMGRVV